MSYRDRAYQTGTATSSTEITLSGAAETKFLTFEQAFQMPTDIQQGGVITWRQVPVFVERANGSWGIHLATLTRSDSGGVIALELETRIQSSVFDAVNRVFSDYGLTNGDVVKVAVVQSHGGWGRLSVAGRGSFDSWQNGDGEGLGGFSEGAKLMGLGLLVAGQGASVGREAGPTETVGGVAIGNAAGVGRNENAPGGYAIGMSANCSYPYSMAIAGYRSWTYNPGEIMHGINDTLLNQGGTTPIETWTQRVFSFIRLAATTDATPTDMALFDPLGSPAPDSPLIIGSAALYCDAGLTDFEAVLTATDPASGDMKRWRLKWTVKTTLDYNTTSLFGTLNKTDVEDDAGAAAWDVDITTDSASNSCSIEVTGAAATEIIWTLSGTIHYSGIYN